MKLLVLVKVTTKIRTSSTSLIESFSLSSRTIIDIYSDNVWVWTMHDFTLVSYKMVWVDCNQFDMDFCFFHFVCLCLNQTEVIFPSLCTSFENGICNGMSSFLREICISIQRENKQLLLVIKSSRGCTFIISHLSVHKRNDNVACLAAFLKKTFSIILSEFSIKTNEFVWLLMWYFLWKINSREK